MTDDRFSKEQQEIDEAAQAHPLMVLCGARSQGDTCELGRGHVGNHRCKTAEGGYRYWWDIVPVEEIERVMHELEPAPKAKPEPGAVPVKPERQ